MYILVFSSLIFDILSQIDGDFPTHHLHRCFPIRPNSYFSMKNVLSIPNLIYFSYLQTTSFTLPKLAFLSFLVYPWIECGSLSPCCRPHTFPTACLICAGPAVSSIYHPISAGRYSGPRNSVPIICRGPNQHSTNFDLQAEAMPTVIRRRMFPMSISSTRSFFDTSRMHRSWTLNRQVSVTTSTSQGQTWSPRVFLV